MRPVVFREGTDPLVGLFGLTRSADLPAGFRDCTFDGAAADDPQQRMGRFTPNIRRSNSPSDSRPEIGVAINLTSCHVAIIEIYPRARFSAIALQAR